MKFDQVINTRSQDVVLREPRVADAQQLAQRALRCCRLAQPTNLYQLQKTPSWLIRASENWVISDRLLHRFSFGYNRFGNDNRSVYFNAGLALEDRPAQPAGHDVPAF